MIKKIITGLALTASLALYSGCSQEPQEEPQSLEQVIEQVEPQDQVVKQVEPRQIEYLEKVEISEEDLLKKILTNHSDPRITQHFHSELTAFKRVLEVRPHIESIAKDYENVNPYALLAIVKQETQGILGIQRSKAGAIGPFQMLYAGNYSFMWDLMFSKSLEIRDPKTGKFRTVPDYSNRNRRTRYEPQIERIQDYLKQHDILITPQESPNAKNITWQNLKEHFAQIKSIDDIPSFREFERYHVGWEMGILYKNYLNTEVKKQIEIRGTEFTPDMSYASFNAGPTRMIRQNGIIPRNGETPHYVSMVNLYKDIFKRVDDLKQAKEQVNNYIEGVNREMQRLNKEYYE